MSLAQSSIPKCTIDQDAEENIAVNNLDREGMINKNYEHLKDSSVVLPAIHGKELSSYSTTKDATPVFNGEGFHIWLVKMKTYLQAFDLWEVVKSDAEPAPLRANPTVAQTRQHADERAKRHKAMSCIQNCVSDVIFTRIMACKTPKQAWDKLKEEFQGTERTSIRLLGEHFDEARIVEKVISTLPERRASRKEEHQEGTFQARSKSTSSTNAYKGNKTWKTRPKPDAATKGDQLCRHCQKKAPNEWLLDSGCTNHMSSDAKIFKALDKSCQTKVKIGNGQFIKAEGKGNVSICTPPGNKIISNVLLVPQIDKNLLSIAQLLEKGYSVMFKGNECQINDPSGSQLMSVKMSDKSFVVNWNKELNLAYSASLDESKLWHQKLGHANFRSLAQMVHEDLVENFTNSVESHYVCEICQLGKQTRLLFPINRAWRALERLQLVHTNVCGPMKTQSLNGSRYFILFIDDYSKYYWIFFLKYKFEIAQVFMKFKVAAETETGCKLKTIRSDNGTEYTLAQFQTLCDDAGIKHQLTNVYTPQKNRASERKNRSLLPTKAMTHETPFEAWFGFKPSLAHLKVFACLCYAHTPAVKRDKLSKRAQPGILVDYSSVKKGYRILNPSTNKVQVSRDVVFDELAYWNWERNEPHEVSKDVLANQFEPAQVGPEMDIDDEPVRGTRPLSEIYERPHVAQAEPSCFEEAKAQLEWKQVMADEISMIEKNQTWELVERPVNRKVIGVKWVYRAKFNTDGSLNKLKAWLVVKGFNQRYGIDYLETFAPMARLDTIKLLVALAAQMKWNVHQLDVKSAFLNGFLEEEIYVEQPQGFQVTGHEDKVYKLKKALYGLKQAPKAWYSRIDSYLTSLKFERSFSEPTLYVKKVGIENQLIVSLYVDDLLVTGGDETILTKFKAKMMEMCDLGLMTYFLGMEVSQMQEGIFLG
ncbi:Retrovirus-related Pol polyprotein from transposon TNT 1-94 [Gossypium australe]|uniref:Retrovirus-related Pol polyprotein from transposon TNT 1-94 n=1 Tax=Gossypium australe TaxID=47621 RepID=A0A5B6WID4_9ROSI|nr:Retrovirus-related Pol polyprotein from transposon TNT 1-94 [Gossypium australe]